MSVFFARSALVCLVFRILSLTSVRWLPPHPPTPAPARPPFRISALWTMIRSCPFGRCSSTSWRTTTSATITMTSTGSCVRYRKKSKTGSSVGPPLCSGCLKAAVNAHCFALNIFVAASLYCSRATALMSTPLSAILDPSCSLPLVHVPRGPGGC